MGFFSSNPPPKKAAAKERCQHCRKSKFDCKCYSNTVKPIREKAKVTDSRGRERTVTRNSKTVGVDGRGIEWCSKCSCRVTNGRCSNATCSTRR